MKYILFAVIMGFFAAPSVKAQQKGDPVQEVVAVEKFAQFVGGGEKLFDYVKRQVIYPSDAKRDSIIGDVHVRFVISVTGEVKPESIKIVKSLSPSCDAEAIRIIRSSPKWVPGATKLAAIEQTVTFPVTFSLKPEK